LTKGFAGPKAIVLLARSASNLSETQREIEAFNHSIEVLALPVDISDEASVVTAFGRIKEKFGAADILINNVAVLAPMTKIMDADVKSWWSDFVSHVSIHTDAHAILCAFPSTSANSASKEVNVRGTFIVTKAFLNLVGSNPGHDTRIINVTTAGAYTVFPKHSSYTLSKLVVSQFTAYLAAEHPTITSICVHPGMVPTDMGTSVSVLAPFMKDTPELVGCQAVWLASGDRKFLSGRYVSANWDVEELEKRKDEIVAEDKLTVLLKGDFGMQQFR
jgi:NAD(P)-dependent dehydrogenase (short-subunit alcohol dehydrogenase family)